MMDTQQDFRIARLENSAVLFIYSMREQIFANPDYQRQSDVWPPEKRQLLIDSLINGYDIPKLYFHEFYPRKKIKGALYRYAIIDGRQRIQSIWEFLEGNLALANDFEYLPDPSVKAANLTYRELAQKYPAVKTRFDSVTLPIMTIQTDDLELIEDMFSRLNEAVPLNAAEKRNALGGPLPGAIRLLCNNRLFFKKKLPFKNKRYRHFDLAAKFLYIMYRKGIADTKKVYLDSFVKSFRNDKATEASKLRQDTEKVLKCMAKVFTNDDDLLRSVGMVMLYFILFREQVQKGWSDEVQRHELVHFERLRTKNRVSAEKDITAADYDLLEFDRLTQSPNDAVALQYRYAVMRRHVGPKAGRPIVPTSDAGK
ncbi:MAG: DUF262 domain-containing protein [Planctomycetota bacterium]|nr:DUF262 domain-containing protein [Planctomycetota bacterium]